MQSCSSRGRAIRSRSRRSPSAAVAISTWRVSRSCRSAARKRSAGSWTAYGPHGLDVRLAGLCDAAEEGAFQRGLERAGLGASLTRADLEQLGFYVCVADLEDELIRTLGATAVEDVIAAQGELGSFRTLQKQSAVARPEDRGSAPALHGQRRQPEDPICASARRRARSLAGAAAARPRSRSRLSVEPEHEASPL